MVWTVFNDPGYEDYYYLNKDLDDLSPNFWNNSKTELLFLFVVWGISIGIY